MSSIVDLERIDGMTSQEIRFTGTDLDKIDGMGDKTVIATSGQNLTIHHKIDGTGTHKLVNFGSVEVLDKVDGSGDRWFINCRDLHIHGRKDGLGNLYLVNTPCAIETKGGAGNIYWDTHEPRIGSTALTDMGKVEQRLDLDGNR